MSKNKPGVPKTKIGDKGRFQDLALQLVFYSELAHAALFYLDKEKRLTQELGYRLELEAKFCTGILFNMMNLNANLVHSMIKQIHVDAEKFQDEVKQFAQAVAPDNTARTLITPDEFKRDMGNQQKQTAFVQRLGKEFIRK